MYVASLLMTNYHDIQDGDLHNSLKDEETGLKQRVFKQCKWGKQPTPP